MVTSYVVRFLLLAECLQFVLLVPESFEAPIH